VRVPYKIVVVLCLALVAGMWWSRTHDMDFMSSRGIKKPLPNFISPGDENAESSLLPDPVSRSAISNEPETAQSKEPEPDPLRLGDLNSAPGLGEYSELASLGAAHLIKAATELEVRGEFLRAHLAWERILDTCDPTPQERTLVGNSIQRLRPTLPRWNIDPNGEYSLLLQFGTTRRKDGAINPVAAAVAEFLRKESSDLVSLAPLITTSQIKGVPDQSPIALYFSGTGENTKNQSDLLSINPPVNDPESLRRDMLTTIYSLIEKRLTSLGSLTPPAPASNPDQPELDFERQLTRLHWQYFARTLSELPKVTPPKTLKRLDLEEETESEEPD
jgi:hypothetical protein